MKEPHVNEPHVNEPHFNEPHFNEPHVMLCLCLFKWCHAIVGELVGEVIELDEF